MKEDIEKRLQLLISISLFFPVFLYNLSRVAGSSETDSLLVSIRVSALAGFYLLNYIIFQNRKKFLKQKSIQKIGKWLLAAIGVFTIPILGTLLSTYDMPSWLSSPIVFLSTTAVVFVLSFPPIIEMIILFSESEKEIKKSGAE